VCALNFSQNQLLQSAIYQYIRILEIELKTLNIFDQIEKPKKIWPYLLWQI
jgi:hypothetical protein